MRREAAKLGVRRARRARNAVALELKTRGVELKRGEEGNCGRYTAISSTAPGDAAGADRPERLWASIPEAADTASSP